MAHRVEHNPMEAAIAALLSQGLDDAGEALRILVNEASKIERSHGNRVRFKSHNVRLAGC
jgi:putative transposase